MAMTVKDLISFLKKQPKDALVAYTFCSEQVLMETDQICTVELCEPRTDGWVQNHRPDKPTRKYLLFPGN